VRQAFLEEMVRLASADGPAVVCLQEVPVWALDELEEWSGMTAVGDVAQRPRLGPIPSTAELGRLITELHHGLFRSAFTGQANAILLRPELRLLDHRSIPLNPYSFRRAQARRLGLGVVPRLVWSKERRVCQSVRVQDGEATLVIGNLHATAYPLDRRLSEAELLRAAVFVDGIAKPAEPLLLCGDLNVTVESSRTLAELTGPEWAFEGGTPTGIDHVLVRGLPVGRAVRWERDRRMHEGRLLSDHTPVDVEVG
jgi:endonuclease/exonuclease/phosphatase family metal-dependent hydrolase